MVRFIGFAVLCFLLPFVFYALWRFVRFGIVPGQEPWPMPIWLRLAGAGTLTMVAAVAVIISFSGGEAGRVYHPARFENGQLIPGGFE